MKSLFKKQLAGNRKPSTTEAFIRTTPTEGTIHINENAAELMGIDYAAVSSDEGLRAEIAPINEEGTLAIVIGGEAKCKLAQPSSKKSGALTFSSAPIWSAMGGNSDENVYYTVSAEDNLVDIDADGNPVSLQEAKDNGSLDENGCYTSTDEEEGTVEGEKALIYYILTFNKREDKPVRNKKSEDDSADDSADATELDD